MEPRAPGHLPEFRRLEVGRLRQSQDIYPFGTGPPETGRKPPGPGVSGPPPPAPPLLTHPESDTISSLCRIMGVGGEEETWILDVLLMMEGQ